MTLTHIRYPDDGSRDPIGRLNSGNLMSSYFVLFDSWCHTAAAPVKTLKIRLGVLSSFFGVTDIHFDFKYYIPFTIQLCWEF